MANRGAAQSQQQPNSFGLAGATDAFSRATLGDGTHPNASRAHSYPIPSSARGRGGGGVGGLAGKRMKPNFKLSDINGDAGGLGAGPPGRMGSGVGGGAAGAGLGAGRPSMADAAAPRRPPGNFGSPFSNFGKIV